MQPKLLVTYKYMNTYIRNSNNEYYVIFNNVFMSIYYKK